MYLISQERRDRINQHLDVLESMREGLDAMAEKWELDGYMLAASLVRDAREYLDDISWLDFTADVEEEEEDATSDAVVS